MKPSGYRQRPDYRVDLLRRRNRFVARRDGKVLADSDRTLVVDEQDHPLVVYFPRDAVAFDQLAEMQDHSTNCPYKGDARYLGAANAPGTPVAWSYDAPYPEVSALAGYVAFFAGLVTITIAGADRAEG